MNDTDALYLYAFISSSDDVVLDIQGIDSQHSLFLIKERALCAVVSFVDMTQFTGEQGDKNLADIQWIGPRAMAHETVVEKISQSAAALPARFGTLFSSRQQLSQVLTQTYDQIMAFLDQVLDKEEWGVKGFCQRQQCVDKIAAEDIVTQGDALKKITPGRRYFEEKKIQTQAEKKFSSWLNETIKQLSQTFSVAWLTQVELKLLSKKATAREEDMVFNWAFLVPKEKLTEFKALVEQVNQTYCSQGVFLELGRCKV